MNQFFLVGTMGLALLFGPVEPSSAKAKKDTWSCTCTCIAYDSGGHRHEGTTMTFNTESSQGCGIGFNIGCHVDDLKGGFAACTGSLNTGSTHGSVGTGGVVPTVTIDGGAKGPVTPKANPPKGGVQQPPAK